MNAEFSLLIIKNNESRRIPENIDVPLSVNIGIVLWITGGKFMSVRVSGKARRGELAARACAFELAVSSFLGVGAQVKSV